MKQEADTTIACMRIEGDTPEGKQERTSQVRRGVIKALRRIEDEEEEPRAIGTIDFVTKLDS